MSFFHREMSQDPPATWPVLLPLMLHRAFSNLSNTLCLSAIYLPIRSLPHTYGQSLLSWSPSSSTHPSPLELFPLLLQLLQSPPILKREMVMILTTVIISACCQPKLTYDNLYELFESGFCTLMSTEMAAGSSLLTIIILLDLNTAFDTISQTTLQFHPSAFFQLHCITSCYRLYCWT